MSRTIFSQRRQTHHPRSEEKKQSKKGLIIDGKYQKILQAIHELYLLNAEQITRLYYAAGSLITVKNRLTALKQEKYIDFLKLPTTEGNAPYLYFLARKGRNHFREQDEEVKDYYRPSKEKEKHYFFLMHVLELNEVLIAAKLLPNYSPAYMLVELLHDIELQHDPFYVTVERNSKARVEGVITETWREETVAVIPDALLEYRRTPSVIPGKPYDRIGLWLEHNRTGGAKRFKQKIRAILEVIGSSAYRKLLDVDRIKVVITTSGGEYRKRKLRTWTEDVLEDMAHKETGTTFSPQAHHLAKAYAKRNIFYFATTPPLGTGCIVPRTFFQEKVWFMPFSANPVALLSK